MRVVKRERNSRPQKAYLLLENSLYDPVMGPIGSLSEWDGRTGRLGAQVGFSYELLEPKPSVN